MGIEDNNAEELKTMLISEGLIDFDDKTFLSSGYSGTNVEIKKITDPSGNELLMITVIVSDEDGTYVYPKVSMNEYEFLYKVDSKPEEYFIGLCKEDDLYHSYFINNSSKSIDLMVYGRSEYKNIPPKSFVQLSISYWEWMFDWSNQINIYLKTGGKELYLGFLMKKYFPAYSNYKVDNIPILNKSGWICK